MKIALLKGIVLAIGILLIANFIDESGFGLWRFAGIWLVLISQSIDPLLKEVK